jgi:3-hydroxyisobutyrate dehydrogenase-like beta-hydroxyacid dehydrogenase
VESPARAGDRLRELGAHVVDSPRAAFQGDAFVSMLSDDAAVRAVVVEGGLFAAKPDTIHINSALSEASALANARDIPTKILLELMTSTLFASPASQIYGKIVRDQSFEPVAGFRLKLGFKDLRLALAASEALNVHCRSAPRCVTCSWRRSLTALKTSTGRRSAKSRSGGRICPAIPRTGNNNEQHPRILAPSDADPNWLGRH